MFLFFHLLNNSNLSFICFLFFWYMQPVASTINTLAGALYKVFCASPDPARKEMRQACFDYLSLGGVFSNGPVSLLSGLNPRPLSLVLHFFAVAIYGVGRLMLPFPSIKRMWMGARLISVRYLVTCEPSLVRSVLLSPIIYETCTLWMTTTFEFCAGCIGNHIPHHQGRRGKANVLPRDGPCVLQRSTCKVRSISGARAVAESFNANKDSLWWHLLSLVQGHWEGNTFQQCLKVLGIQILSITRCRNLACGIFSNMWLCDLERE